MCTQVLVVSAGEHVTCDTVGELADALDVATCTVSDDGREFCLCNTRLSSISARRATDAEGWPFPSHVVEVR